MPVVDAALLESHEAACQEADASYVAAGGRSNLEGTERLLVLQTFDRPVHMYSDGTWLVLCVARAGLEPRLDRYGLAELAADRLDLATNHERPPLELVTPLSGYQENQFGVYTLWFGVLDPIVQGLTFEVAGLGAVDGAVGAGPALEIGAAHTDLWFLAQWNVFENYESWTAYDSCGAVLGNITQGGAPTPCPPTR